MRPLKIDDWKARKAERRFRFRDAFYWYNRAGRSDDEEITTMALLRAARCLEMGEEWRAESASWEWLANYIGLKIDSAWLADRRGHGFDEPRQKEILDARYKVPSPNEPASHFYVISDKEWRDPPGQKYENDTDKVRRHHRASAYEWGANHALANYEHNEAARLFRRAGLAWEQSERSDRMKRAARCYYQAALAATRAARTESRQGVLDPWCPGCLRDKTRESNCKHEQHLLLKDRRLDEAVPGETLGSDLQRLHECMKDVMKVIKNAEGKPAALRCMGDEDRWLTAIQNSMATYGSKQDAIRIYRQRNDYQRESLKIYQPVRWLRESLAWQFSRKGSSVWRALAWLAGSTATAPEIHAGPRAAEALTYSLSTLVTLSTSHFRPGGWVTNFFQSLQALSAYFSLGYLLWISQRSYEG
jgi:hypothetical protein